MNKVIKLGTYKSHNDKDVPVYCKIEFKDNQLSISGVEGPYSGGDCYGACGQINMSLNPNELTPAKGWSLELIQRFLNVWDKWHLNDMKAGSPNQRKYLEENTIKKDYDNARMALEKAGLSPDKDFIHNGKPYLYGSAWLFETVPTEIITWLESLPNSDTEPAWI